MSSSLAATEKVAIALSGGADSMALLLMLKNTYPQLHALTVDHCLRQESATEAAQVASWCNALGIPHTILVWQHGEITSGMPERARDARYSLMIEWCKQNHTRHLFTAHHLDDQIETMLFRLIRGSGLVGLAGMLPITSRGDIMLHRPLLSTPKAALIEILTQAGQPWLEDPSNQNLQFTRNALRVHLQSLTADQKRRFDVLAKAFARFRAGLESRVNAALRLCYTGNSLKHNIFIELPRELKLRILEYICYRISGNTKLIRSEKVARLLSSIESQNGKFTLHGVMFIYDSKQNAWYTSGI